MKRPYGNALVCKLILKHAIQEKKKTFENKYSAYVGNSALIRY